ncbi:hypothetical protein LCGC14_0879510 [marine sediment metagenome]|uniref:Uncharacterized protein n=1 Tax=marine sediment metagenome TaxID=412755 RepID=A0A0F9P785_9ZZZZ
MAEFGKGAEARNRIRRMDCAEAQELINFSKVRRYQQGSPEWLYEMDKLYEAAIAHECEGCALS